MTELAHKDRTVQDIIDGLTPEQRETVDLVVGAAVEDEVIEDPEVLASYDALSDEHKYLIDFFVGNILAEEIEHDALLIEDFLAHFGVKGMQWGVRNVDRPAGAPRLSKMAVNTKENRREAREKVKTGSATLGEAHKAALKSTGHRAINAFTGDRRFWRNMAITAGVVGVGAAASFAAPAVVPATILTQLGTGAYQSISLGMGLGTAVPASITTADLVSLGSLVVTATALNVTALGGAASTAVNAGTNLVRAVRGNARVDNSYAKLGKSVQDRQTAGAKKTRKVLSKSGGLKGAKLKQSDELRVGNFLEHHLDTTLGSMKPGA